MGCCSAGQLAVAFWLVWEGTGDLQVSLTWGFACLLEGHGGCPARDELGGAEICSQRGHSALSSCFACARKLVRLNWHHPALGSGALPMATDMSPLCFGLGPSCLVEELRGGR